MTPSTPGLSLPENGSQCVVSILLLEDCTSGDEKGG